MIRELDEVLQVAPVLVPADGNCMAWSLLCLHTNEFANQNFKTKKAVKAANSLRSIIKEMWVEKAEDARWQAIFTFCYQDHMLQPAEEPRDPASKEGPASAKPKVQRAAAAAPVPIAVREPLDPTLRTATGMQAQAFLEPQLPDVEGTISQSLLKGHLENKSKLPGMEFDIADWNDDGNCGKKKLARHKRMVKKLPPDERKVKDGLLAKFLAAKQLTNGDFMRIHRRNAVFRKAGKCPDGFIQFRKSLINGKMPECKVCVDWLSSNGVTLEQVEKLLAGPAEAPAQDPKPETQPKQVPQPKLSREAVRAQCVEYIKSIPHLEAVDGFVLQYRCKICISRKQGEGKLNSLGQKPQLNQVRTFIGEHIESQCHVKALAQLEQEQLVTSRDDLQSPDLECEGYDVSDPNSPGTLHWYLKEFGLWATHTKLDTKACHFYKQNATTGAWIVMHKECSGRRPQGSMCCQKCAKLGEPKGVQRLVVNFARNFYSAMLLSKRLFATPAEMKDFMQEMDASSFAVFHAYLWSRIQQQSLFELQTYVASTYQSFPPHLANDHMHLFLGAVVIPCLRVNVTQINEGLAPVAAQFVQALANRRLTDTWLRWLCFVSGAVFLSCRLS